MRKQLLQIFSLIALLLLKTLSSEAQQQIYAYTNATNGAYNMLAANLTATNLVTVGSWGSNTPCSNGGGISGLTTAPGFSTYNPANTGSPALNVNITPNTGYYIQVNAISAAMRRSSTGPAKARLAYSTDGGVTWINNGNDYVPNNGSCGSFATHTWTLTTPVYVCSGMLKVRIYYFASTATSGTCQTANLRITGAVIPVVPPALSINANPAGPICPGTPVTFTAIPVNGGPLPSYTWFRNGSITGTNSSSYADNTLTSTDVITCQMTSNAPCANTDPVTSNAISMVVLQPVTVTIQDTLCSGAQYTLGTQILNTSGTYTDTFTAVNSCDSIVVLNLFVRPAITHSVTDSICAAANYNWGSQTLNTSGTYNQVFSSYTSCDSTVTLNLFVRPAITHAFTDTICAATNYNWGSQTLNTSGTYNQNFSSYTNCDSTVTLNLFVRPAITHAFNDSICAATSYNWGTQTLSTSGTYNQSFSSYTNCDSSVTLHLFVRPAITHAFNDTICAATSYNWGTQTLNTSGTYNQNFSSSANCDSTVTLNLFVRPAITHAFNDTICAATSYNWGTQTLNTSGTYNQNFSSSANCDSTVTLNLFVRPAINHTFNDTICAATSYSWGTQTLNTSGIYNQVFNSSANCDSTVTLNLFVRPAINHTFSDTTCAATTYSWGTQTLNTSGTYNQNFSSYTNCDSSVTLHLFVRPAINHTFSDTTCAATTYSWGTQTLNTSGTYNQNFSSYTNCDSSVTLHLFVRPAINHTFSDTTCAATTYSWGTQTLNTSGTYNQNFSSYTNCDSSVILNLFVRPAINHTFSDTTCAATTYSWSGQSYTSTGSYSQVLAGYSGCDSTVTLSLYVRPAITHALADTICSGTLYNWGGQSLTTTGSFVHNFTSFTNCDSTVTLQLFVRPVQNATDTQYICFGTGYPFGGQVLTTSGIYSHTFTDNHGCDSIATLTLYVDAAITHTIAASVCSGTVYNWGTQSYTSGGTFNQGFTAANGCDSMVTLHLTINPTHTDTLSVAICHGASYILGSLNLNQSGTYAETFTNITGCDSIITVHLTVSAPVLTQVRDTSACGMVFFEGNSYTQPAVLYDTFKTALGCDSLYRTVNITPYANPVIQVTDTTGCGNVVFEGHSYNQSTTLQDTLVGQSGCDSLVRVIHILVNRNESQTLVHEMCAGDYVVFNGQQYTDEGNYPHLFKTSAGCDSLVTLQVKINPLPVITIDHETISNHCIGDSIRLQASGATSYLWQYHDQEQGPEHYLDVTLYEANNYFSVSGTDDKGCKNNTEIKIAALPCCAIWMPNAFSPNADGLNDVFQPESQGHPREYALHIFNRWGATVFSSFNPGKGWDGTINSKPAEIGDYYYRVTGKCVNGELINLKGTCTLIR